MGSNSPALDVPGHVLDYLQEQPTLTLATASATGTPRATTLIYVNDGPTVYVWTRPDTATARHMEQNPAVSFAIDEYTSDFRATKGIQATGEASVVLNPAEVKETRQRFRVSLTSAGLRTTEDRKSTRLNSSHLGISYAV